MQYKNIFIKTIFVIIISFVFQTCLKDNISPQISFDFTSSLLLLNYLEGNGDYINSENMPSVVNVDEVQNNLGNYLILDIRTPGEYIAGHIPGAVNLTPDSLINYLENKSNINSYIKIVIVSTSGQASSYFTCLLRLYGINNVYSLNFGMAQWNSVFSEIWLNNIADILTPNFDNIIYPKGPMSPIPDIKFDHPDSSIQQNVNARILDLIRRGFKEVSVNITANQGIVYFDINGYYDFYIVCYGTNVLYLQDRLNTTGSGHFNGAVNYVPWYDFRSTSNLQTLPPNRTIIIYSTSGQQSAFIAAYLRLLGYDARTLRFGVSDIFYSKLPNEAQWLAPFVFFQDDIRDYNYVTGSSPN